MAASFAGWIRTTQGDYFMAWLTAGGLCLAAAGACLLVPPQRRWARQASGLSRRGRNGFGARARTSVKIVRLLRRVAGVHHTLDY